jgi:carbonic anhydrase/acetyltransferase-like protein (isoleucine patch superfamily)
MGSIIADGVKINSNSLIGAGTFIPLGKEIPKNSVVMGSPAKIIKKICEEDLNKMSEGRVIYRELSKRYLKFCRKIVCA